MYNHDFDESFLSNTNGFGIWTKSLKIKFKNRAKSYMFRQSESHEHLNVYSSKIYFLINYKLTSKIESGYD